MSNFNEKPKLSAQENSQERGFEHASGKDWFEALLYGYSVESAIDEDHVRARGIDEIASEKYWKMFEEFKNLNSSERQHILKAIIEELTKEERDKLIGKELDHFIDILPYFSGEVGIISEKIEEDPEFARFEELLVENIVKSWRTNDITLIEEKTAAVMALTRNHYSWNLRPVKTHPSGRDRVEVGEIETTD